jgi:hypothetical protein
VNLLAEIVELAGVQIFSLERQVIELRDGAPIEPSARTAGDIDRDIARLELSCALPSARLTGGR